MGTAFQLAKMNVIVDKEDVQVMAIRFVETMIQMTVQNGAKLLLALSVRSAITEYVYKLLLLLVTTQTSSTKHVSESSILFKD
jgi:hypothetical protein